MTLDLIRAGERTPARPGPGTLSEGPLRALEMTLARRVEGLLSGDFRSRLFGTGTELAQIRPYVSGDDVRQIDWKATARTGVPHVRVQLADRVLITWIVLDVSPSMDFGTAERRKLDVAEGIALAFGYAASRRGNRVGTILFGRDGTIVRPPRAGQAGLLGLVLGLRGEGRPSGGVTLADALRRTARLARHPALVVLASDFRGPLDWRRPLLELAGRHEVIATEVRDPREQELPDVGDVRLVDPETRRQVRVDTSNPTMRRRFAVAAANERRAVAKVLSAAGVRHVVLDTEEDWLRDLTTFLRERPARR
ncbi:MAG: DUF58 domain-containing protein [Gaiellaceae bacterium]